MDANSSPTSRCAQWQPSFDSLLKPVREASGHGELSDLCDRLKGVVTSDRPLVMLCPHADDGAITAAGLLHEYAVNRGFPVIEVLVFTGERNVDAHWLNREKKASVRESEFRLECQVLGAEAVLWHLDAYRNPGYQPSPADIDKIVNWFRQRTPGAIIVPPATDAHQAHRMTRALGAIGLVGAGLKNTLVLTGWTPWGPLPRPNAYFSYDDEAERVKEWAINCHASQVRLTDYTEFCNHLGRAYMALTREWSEGHRLGGRVQREDGNVGVELFQVETFEAAPPDVIAADPIQTALGILGGHLAPPDAAKASAIVAPALETAVAGA